MTKSTAPSSVLCSSTSTSSEQTPKDFGTSKMADNTTQQAQPTFVGPSKALKTDYPVRLTPIGAAMARTRLTNRI